MEKSTQEPTRELSSNVALPPVEHYTAQMLRPRAVLWKQAGPVLPEAGDVRASVRRSEVDLAFGTDRANRGGYFLLEHGIAIVAGDAQRVDAPAERTKATVAEVEAEEVRIRPAVGSAWRIGAPGTLRRPHGRRELRSISPVANRGAADADLLAD
jgi:hypothetical protein